MLVGIKVFNMKANFRANGISQMCLSHTVIAQLVHKVKKKLSESVSQEYNDKSILGCLCLKKRNIYKDLMKTL